MPSIISPTGRALQAELQNMPPDQVQAYLAQNVGKVPMAELLAMKMQLDRMRQAMPQQQAPQSTVAQDMQAQLQQARGISSLPVQNVGQPRNYAGGGIVAFQNRGLVDGTMYVNPQGGVSSSLPPRNLPATLGRQVGGAEDSAAFWKKVTEFMKAGASESEAIAAAKKVARIGGATSAILGTAYGLYSADKEKEADEYLRSRGKDPSQMSEQELIWAGESAAGLGALKGLAAPFMPSTYADLYKGAKKAFTTAYEAPETKKRSEEAERQAGGAKYMSQMQEAIKRAPATAPTPERRERVGLPAALPKPVAAAPTPAAQVAETTVPTSEDRDYESFLREIEKSGQERGIGKAITEREAYLKGKKAETEKDLADRARMSRAQAFFKMAEESAKPGGTLLKGATAGLSQYAEAKQALADRRESIEERAKEMEFTLAQAKEQQAVGNMNAARQLYQRYEDNRQKLEAEKRGYAHDIQMQGIREAGAAARSREATDRAIAANELRKVLESGRARTAKDRLVFDTAKAVMQSEPYKQLSNQLMYVKDPEEKRKINAQLSGMLNDSVVDILRRISEEGDLSEAESIIGADLGEVE